MNAYWLEAQGAVLLSIQCELEGMKAENAVRAHRGESPAYGEEAFAVLSSRALGIANQISEMRQYGAEYK